MRFPGRAGSNPPAARRGAGLRARRPAVVGGLDAAPTPLPDLTFRDELTVELGDSRVEMRHHGPNNGYGSVSMRFMPANVLFVVDWIVVGRMPYRDLLNRPKPGFRHFASSVNI